MRGAEDCYHYEKLRVRKFLSINVSLVLLMS